jgi:HCOMODA/2-hydroxy-3-carboxy-muconic semialdehyde decarboxylase
MFSVTDRKLEPVHNHGSFFAGGVPVFFPPDLISTVELGEQVATTMGDQPAVLLRGNGQVTVGRTVPEAVMMAIYLEEAAEILQGALQIGTPIPLTIDEAAKRQVEALPPVDLERAWNYFKDRVGVE